MSTSTLYISSGAYDGAQTDAATWSNGPVNTTYGNAVGYASNSWLGGWTFLSAAIAPNQVVNTATFNVFLSRSYKQPVLEIRGVKSANKTAFGSSNLPIQATLTTAFSSQTISDGSLYDYLDLNRYLTFDVTSIVQEIVNDSNWNINDPIQFVVNQHSGDSAAWVYLYDYDNANYTGNETSLFLDVSGNPSLVSTTPDPITTSSVDIVLNILNVGAVTQFSLVDNDGLEVFQTVKSSDASSITFDPNFGGLAYGDITLRLYYSATEYTSNPINYQPDSGNGFVVVDVSNGISQYSLAYNVVDQNSNPVVETGDVLEVQSIVDWNINVDATFSQAGTSENLVYRWLIKSVHEWSNWATLSIPDGTTSPVPPQFISTPTTNVVAGGSYTYIVYVIDNNGDAITINLDSGPTWLTLNNGVLSGTAPNDGTTISSDVTLSATANGDTVYQTFTINVNQKPSFTSSPITSLNEGDVYSYTPTVSDANVADTVTIDAVTIPSWLTWDGTTLTGTMPAEQVVNYQVSLSASDGVSTVYQTYNITANRAPFLTSVTTISANNWGPVTYDATSDSDPNTVYSLVGAPTEVTISGAQVTMNYTTAGSTSFVLRLTNNGLSRDYTIDVVVDGAPIFYTANTFNVFVNTFFNVEIYAKDPEDSVIDLTKLSGIDNIVFNPLTTPETRPEGLCYIGNLFGIIDAVGDYDVDIQAATTNSGTSTQTITFSATVATQAPNFTSSNTVNVNNWSTGTYQATTDDGNAVISLVNPPTGISIDGNGLVSISLSQAGNTSFVLRATNTYGSTDFTVTAVVDGAPVFYNSNLYTTLDNLPVSIAIEANDPEGNVVTLTAQNLPAGLSFVQDSGTTVTGNGTVYTGTISGTLYAGTYQVDVTASTTSSGSTTQTIDITITASGEVQEPPYFISEGKTIAIEGSLYSYPVVAADPNGDLITLTMTSGPSWLSFVGTSLRGTPPSGTGNTSVDVTINAASTTFSVDQTYTLNIKPAVITVNVKSNRKVFSPGVFVREIENGKYL